MLNTMLIDLKELNKDQKDNLRHFLDDNKILYLTRIETEEEITDILDINDMF